MRTVAIVSEFNPFHLGHRYLVDSVRLAYGPDTCIIALMSGNYTQRGDAAFADKLTRAASAIEGGVDLVLELPLPYAIASAEYFARAGVRLAAALGVVDTLAFGSECGDIDLLTRVAQRLSSEEYLTALRKEDKAHPDMGHARTAEGVYRALYGDEGASLLASPNNVLALEYIRANLALPSPLALMTVKRLGDYHSLALQDASASAIRASLLRGEEDGYLAMPEASRAPLRAAVASWYAPAALSRLGPILLSFFRFTAPPADDDLGHRLKKAAVRAVDFEEFLALAATKRYTHAHLRRAVLHRYLGITSADISAPPAYTQVLGMNERGRIALRRAAKAAAIPILTKPADAREFCGAAARQVALAQRGDLIYPLAMPVPMAGNAFILASPYCKK